MRDPDAPAPDTTAQNSPALPDVAALRFDPAEKPDDSALMAALKRAFRGEPFPTFEERIQEIRGNPPIKEWQSQILSSVGRMANEYIWHLSGHLVEAISAEDQDLILQIARQIGMWRNVVNDAEEEVRRSEWIESRTRIWNEAWDKAVAKGADAFLAKKSSQPVVEDRFTPDVPSDLPADLISWFRREMVERLVREHLSKVFPDGPRELLLFVYKGRPIPGLTEKPWRLLNHLWKQRVMRNREDIPVRSAHFSDLSAPVLGDDNQEYTAGHFGGHRRACNKFFEDNQLPFFISSTGQSKEFNRTAVLEFRPD